MRKSADEIKIDELKTEIRQMKALVTAWNDPKCRVLGTNDVCDLLGLTRPEVQRLSSEKLLPSHQFTSGKLYFFENEIISSLKKELLNK